MTIKTQRLLARAKKLTKKGQIEESQKIYSTILKSFPNNQEAKKELSTLIQRKEINQTQVQFEEIIQLYSNGQFQEAIDKIIALSDEHPKAPLLFNILGASYRAIKQLDNAVKSFEKAIDIKPEYDEALFNLGVTLSEIGKVDDAITSYKKVIEINNAYHNAHNNLGLILLEYKQLDNAIDHFEWAISFKPDFAEAHNNLGSALLALGKIDAAVECFKKAVEFKPDYSIAHNNQAIGLLRLGQNNDAINSLEKALSYRPDFASAHHNLSGLKKYTKSDTQITKMQSLLSNKSLSQSDQKFLYFALAKAYEDIGKHDQLFKFLHKGNQLRSLEINSSLDEYQNNYSIFRKLFRSYPPNINKTLKYKKTKIRPIFIVGMPRSGTTLVEQIIASHHEVYGAGELDTLTKLINQNIKNLLDHQKKGLTEKYFLSIRQEYLDSLSRLNVSENIITDKWPLNFQYIGFILTVFPEAKIIHLNRNPVATCWSIYKHYFSDRGNGWAYNFEDLGEFYGLYSELMKFWHELFPNKIYDLNYEKLTTNQEKETKKLLAYCELKWDKNCLNFHTNKRDVKTASASQVRKKMYQGSSEDWKKYESHIQPLIDKLKSYHSPQSS
jgi:tetratricopeptide (TPR) repeat protein